MDKAQTSTLAVEARDRGPRDDFTPEERAALSAYYHDRDRRGVRGFVLTKLEIVAIMRAAKSQTDREKAAEAVGVIALEPALRLPENELTRILMITHPEAPNVQR